jgi:hypothetical protein
LIVVAAFKAPAVVAGLDDVTVMGQPVEQRGRHFGITERDRVPLFLSGSCLTSRSLTRIISFLGIGLRC